MRKALTIVRLGALGVLALVAAELGARAEDQLRLGVPFWHTPDYDRDLKLTDSLGTRGRPGGVYKKWRLNRWGFRSPEMDSLPKGGCTRVLVLGASEAFGYAEPDGQEFPAQLRDTLAHSGCYEVANGAIAGMGLESIRRFWENWGSRFGASVVVLYVNPLFYLGERAPQRPSGVGGRAAAVGWRPRLIERARDAFDKPQLWQQHQVRRRLRAVEQAHSPDWLYREPPAERLASYSSDLEDVVQTIVSHGVTPVLVAHASMTDTVPRTRREAFAADAYRQFMPRATRSVLASFGNSAARATALVASRNGVPFVDLRGRMAGRSDWFADYVHFTAAGAGVAAGAIAASVTANLESRGHNDLR